jgi:hypothetical protein
MLARLNAVRMGIELQIPVLPARLMPFGRADVGSNPSGYTKKPFWIIRRAFLMEY